MFLPPFRHCLTGIGPDGSWAGQGAFTGRRGMFASWPQILLVVLLMVLLFGRGKISDLMSDVAKGIKSFKQGMADDPDDDQGNREIRAIEHEGSSSRSEASDKCRTG